MFQIWKMAITLPTVIQNRKLNYHCNTLDICIPKIAMTSVENSVFANFHEFFIMTYKKYWIFAFFDSFGGFVIQVGQETDRIRTACKLREKLELYDRHVMTNSLWLILNIEFWQFSDLFGEVLTAVGHETDILWTDCKSLEILKTKNRHVMTDPLWLISNMRFWLFRPFSGLFWPQLVMKLTFYEQIVNL